MNSYLDDSTKTMLTPTAQDTKDRVEYTSQKLDQSIHPIGVTQNTEKMESQASFYGENAREEAKKYYGFHNSVKMRHKGKTCLNMR